MTNLSPVMSPDEFRFSGAYAKRICTGRWINEHQWTEAFKPLTNPVTGDPFFDPGRPEDAAFLDAVGEGHIWTDFDINIDGSDIDFVIMPGRYAVERLGHLVTLVPWTIHQADLVVPWKYPPGLC